MPHAALSAAIARTRSAVAPLAETDGELLGRYVRSRDEAAFAGLVRTLGPMVLGVCRRVAGDEHLADDAFQAAFLVLARRAADVSPREAVRGWLYGVAVRTAREARTVSARRRARECSVPVLPDRAATAVEPPDADALRILDEEVAALPDHLRTAVVLCELDGLSRRVAAERLGVAEGTLSSRLGKARKVLADRVRKRGVALPAAGLGTLLAASPVSATLAAKTSALLTTGPVPAAVAALSNGVFRTMYMRTLVAVCAVCAVALGLPMTPEIPRRAQAVGRAAPNGIAVRTARGIEFWDETGKQSGTFALPQRPGVQVWPGPISRDGKHIVLARAAPSEVGKPYRVSVAPLDGGLEVDFDGEHRVDSFVWAADGVVIGMHHAYEGLESPGHFRHTRFDVPCRSARDLGIHARPENERDRKYQEPYPQSQLGLKDGTSDGKWFAVTDQRWGGGPGGLHLTDSVGKLVRRLTPEGVAVSGAVFSPDGRTLLFNLVGDSRKVVKRLVDGLYRLDVATGAMALVAGTNEPDGRWYWSASTGPFRAAWRTDGNRIAVQRVRVVDPEWWPEVYTNEVFVCDPDGKNRREVIGREVKFLQLHGWR